jgi:uncharacterized protein VirK/YbjX
MAISEQVRKEIISGKQESLVRKEGKLYFNFDLIKLSLDEFSGEITLELSYKGKLMASRSVCNNFRAGDSIHISGLKGTGEISINNE